MQVTKPAQNLFFDVVRVDVGYGLLVQLDLVVFFVLEVEEGLDHETDNLESVATVLTNQGSSQNVECDPTRKTVDR